MSQRHHAYIVGLDGGVFDYDSEFYPPQEEPEIELRIPHGIDNLDVVRLLAVLIGRVTSHRADFGLEEVTS